MCSPASLELVFHVQVLKRTFVPGILHGLLAEKHRPAEHSSASLPAVPALTYLVPQKSWEWGYREYAFHSSLFLRRAAFGLCTPCFTLSFGNLPIYCAHGVGLGKWNGGSEVWWETAKQRCTTAPVKSSPAVFSKVYPIKGFINLAGAGNALASRPGGRVVAVQLNFGTGEGHCLSSSVSPHWRWWTGWLPSAEIFSEIIQMHQRGSFGPEINMLMNNNKYINALCEVESVYPIKIERNANFLPWASKYPSEYIQEIVWELLCI